MEKETNYLTGVNNIGKEGKSQIKKGKNPPSTGLGAIYGVVVDGCCIFCGMG
jgi:hypothetical protein